MRQRISLLAEAYQCGEVAAFAFLANEEAGFSKRRIHRADAAKARADEIADVVGPEAAEAFDDGFSAILPPFGEPLPGRGPGPAPPA